MIGMPEFRKQMTDDRYIRAIAIDQSIEMKRDGDSEEIIMSRADRIVDYIINRTLHYRSKPI
jgi:hypothetical protein